MLKMSWQIWFLIINTDQWGLTTSCGHHLTSCCTNNIHSTHSTHTHTHTQWPLSEDNSSIHTLLYKQPSREVTWPYIVLNTKLAIIHYIKSSIPYLEWKATPLRNTSTAVQTIRMWKQLLECCTSAHYTLEPISNLSYKLSNVAAKMADLREKRKPILY